VTHLKIGRKGEETDDDVVASDLGLGSSFMLCMRMRADPREIAVMCTFSWRPQVALGEEGIGFVHMRRYVVAEQKASAEACAKGLWNEA
jgi:hypothetical protein